MNKVIKTNYAMTKLLSYNCRYLDEMCTVNLKYLCDIAKDIYDMTIHCRRRSAYEYITEWGYEINHTPPLSIAFYNTFRCIFAVYFTRLTRTEYACRWPGRSHMMTANGNIFCVTDPLWGENHRLPVDSPHKGQWRGSMLSLICAWINGWANNRDAGDLRRHRTHYDVTVMISHVLYSSL